MEMRPRFKIQYPMKNRDKDGVRKREMQALRKNVNKIKEACVAPPALFRSFRFFRLLLFDECFTSRYNSFLQVK